MGCSCPKPVLLWIRLWLWKQPCQSCEEALLQAFHLLSQEGHLSWALCILSLELCCSLSCAQPHPSLDLNHWLAFLAKPQICLVTVGWLWWSWTVADPGFSQTCSAFPAWVLCLCPWSVPLPLLWSPSAPDSPPLAEVAALKCFLTRVPLLIQEQGSTFPFPDHSMKNQYRKYRHTQMLNLEGGYPCTSFLSL